MEKKRQSFRILFALQFFIILGSSQLWHNYPQYQHHDYHNYRIGHDCSQCELNHDISFCQIYCGARTPTTTTTSTTTRTTPRTTTTSTTTTTTTTARTTTPTTTSTTTSTTPQPTTKEPATEKECGTFQESWIENGEITHSNELPWMALLEDSTDVTRNRFRCIGTLINERSVLTAAHCNSRKRTIVAVHLGMNDKDQIDRLHRSRRYLVKKFIEHPKFNLYNYQDDVGLIVLQDAVTYESYIKPICLPIHGKNFPGKAIVAAWGLSSRDPNFDSKILTKSAIAIYDCSSHMSSIVGVQFWEGGICASKSGISKIDSGAPLFAIEQSGNEKHFVLFGITSRFPGSSISKFTNIANLMAWIQQNII